MFSISRRIFLLIFILSKQVICSNTVEHVSQLIEDSSVLTKKKNEAFYKLGEHIIIEFLGSINLDHYAVISDVLRQAASQAGATVLKVEAHKFEPCGMTCLAMLQESHISVHTWPEHGYVAIDIFTCGSHVNIDKALEVLQDFFKPQKVELIRLDRGFVPDDEE